MKLLICSLLVLFLSAYAFLFIKAGQQDNELQKINMRLEQVMPAIVIARDYHQRAVDHPELFRHDPVANNDAGWVIIYDEIIAIRKAIEELVK